MKVLITAGTVYGKLDDNKLVGNRIRGIWASKFAVWLANKGYETTLMMPDTTVRAQMDELERGLEPGAKQIKTEVHKGYESYAEQCYAFAPTHDAAVMAAAVVNWIPKTPFKGKMPTAGFREGDEQLIPFILAPRVIDRMKKLNPKLTLIGCKMTSGATHDETYRAAYDTLIKGHCNVVLANDLSVLKKKFLVWPDGSTIDLNNDFEALYQHLDDLFRDKFYRTEPQAADYKDVSGKELDIACATFDLICNRYRARFTKRPHGGPERVFGSVGVHIQGDAYLVSPREKGMMFDSKDAAVVTAVNRKDHVVHTVRGKKATLNAPLLISVMKTFSERAVVHLHEEQPGWPTLPYGPPGSVRDNDRDLAKPEFNIHGHGCVFIPNL